MDQPSSATHGHFLSKLRQKSVNKLDFLLGQNISSSRNDLSSFTLQDLDSTDRLWTKSFDKYTL